MAHISVRWWGGTQALINLAPRIPQLRMEVIPMRGRVVRGIPRALQEIWTTQRRKMNRMVNIISSWDTSGLGSDRSAFSGTSVAWFCARFAFRDRSPSSTPPTDGLKSLSLKAFGVDVASVWMSPPFLGGRKTFCWERTACTLDRPHKEFSDTITVGVFKLSMWRSSSESCCSSGTWSSCSGEFGSRRRSFGMLKISIRSSSLLPCSLLFVSKVFSVFKSWLVGQLSTFLTSASPHSVVVGVK